MTNTKCAIAFGAVICALSSSASAQVRVELATPNTVLEIRDDSTHRWSAVCQAPCNRWLPANASYRINGDGVQPSRAFELEGDHVQLNVVPHSAGWHTFGIALIPLGAISIGSAIPLMLMSALIEQCSSCVAGYADTTTLNIGWTMIAAGAVALVTGIVLVASTRTQVTLSNESTPSFMRTPMFESRRTPILPLPQTYGVPIVSLTF